ncbi:MAG TPA: ChbG/HpnK family deacetylase [Thermoanaerobaculia bacterium]|nr:ChbG/HpnK family deacetylase [Thermoanaerobaculia bacterium]
MNGRREQTADSRQQESPAVRQLIVTADDVALDPGMTAGAIEAHRNGIVTRCSIVANGVAFDDAVARLKDVPAIAIGVHLALVEARALTTGELMPRNYVRFLLSRKKDPEPELRAQIEKVLATGLRVTHLNGHQHLHMLPRIFELVQRLAIEYHIPYVRTVRDFGGRVPLARRLATKALSRFNNRGSNDRTIGVANAGHLDVGLLLELLDYVGGVTELVTHPGLGVTRYPHWKYEWDRETRALCDPRVREAIRAKGIELRS